MDYRQDQEAAAKQQAYAAQTDARAYQQSTALASPPDDPASLRQQHLALGQLCERLSVQRNNLRDIADTVLGAEPEETQAGGIAANRIQPVGGVTADIISMFEAAAMLLNQVDRQIARLQRVSS